MCGSNFYETDVTTTVCDLTKKKKTFKFKLPRAIFSPESGGRQNTRTVKVDIIMHGNTMLYM